MKFEHAETASNLIEEEKKPKQGETWFTEEQKSDRRLYDDEVLARREVAE